MVHEFPNSLTAHTITAVRELGFPIPYRQFSLYMYNLFINDFCIFRGSLFTSTEFITV